MRKPLVIANWKMQLAPLESEALARAVAEEVATVADAVEVVLCPSFTSLGVVSAALAGTAIALGAQDVFPAPHGALTGMVGFDELRALGVSHILVGHSERRQVLAETDEEIAKKFHGAIAAGFVPVLCVGETAKEKAGGEREAVLARELGILADLAGDTRTAIVIAYEPVWAIGTGVSCTPEEAAEVHRWIRKTVTQHVSEDCVCVLYGGSVDEKNAAAFATQEAIDGVLVGGASLRKESFLAIAAAFARAK
ncbi:triose-phosphate isomerase [Patescibacteria group bacterium]|nr:triose-phosphate isomerase [Patescibacteria group bacterium]